MYFIIRRSQALLLLLPARRRSRKTSLRRVMTRAPSPSLPFLCHPAITSRSRLTLMEEVLLMGIKDREGCARLYEKQ